MKKLFVVMLLLASFTIEAQTEVVPETGFPNGYSVSVALNAESRYVGDSGVVFSEGPVYKPEVTVTERHGLYFTLAGVGGFESKDESAGEVDYIMGLGLELGTSYVDLGMGYYDFSRFFERQENAWAFFLDVSREFEKFNSFFGFKFCGTMRAEAVVPESGSSYDSSYLVKFGPKFVKDFDDGKGLSLDCGIVYDGGTYGSEEHFSGRLKLEASAPIGQWQIVSSVVLHPFSGEPTVLGLGMSRDF